MEGEGTSKSREWEIVKEEVGISMLQDVIVVAEVVGGRDSGMP